MKVKELAEIFKVPTQELLNMLSNVGVNLDQQEETMIDAQWEKKLAKRYNVPYPFKAASKPDRRRRFFKTFYHRFRLAFCNKIL